MRAGRPSKTAEHNALFRALETSSSLAPAPIEDPYAFGFLSPPFRCIAGVARWRLPHRAIVGFIDRRWPGVRSSVVARTQLIDEIVQRTVAGTGQTVLLGAGFDSRPYRLPCLDSGPVFEVDHPDTQRRKRSKLDPAHLRGRDVRFVPTDFHLDHLDEALTAEGFDRQVPTLFLWEGVTNYLTPDAVDATLRWCAGAAAGSHVVFTYVDHRVLHDPTQYQGAERVLETSRRAGEPVTFGLDPQRVPEYLHERGLALETDTGASTYREAYYGSAAQHIRGHEFYRVAHARIRRPTACP